MRRMSWELFGLLETDCRLAVSVTWLLMEHMLRRTANPENTVSVIYDLGVGDDAEQRSVAPSIYTYLCFHRSLELSQSTSSEGTIRDSFPELISQHCAAKSFRMA